MQGKIYSLEKINPMFSGSRLTVQFAASYNTPLCEKRRELTEGLQRSTV
jgi:hypothetical protein